AAVARAGELEHSLRTRAALAILDARDDLSDAERRTIAAELGWEPLFEAMLGDEVVERLADDPVAAWAAIRQLPATPAQIRQFATVLNTWARTDPEAALAAVADLSPNLRQMLTQPVVIGWAQRDADGALEWARDQDDRVTRSAALQSVVTVVAQRDPQRAAELAMSLPAGPERALAGAETRGGAHSGAAR